MSTSSVRSARTPARVVDAPSRSASPAAASPLSSSRSAWAARAVGSREEVLHDAVVEVGGDQPALGVGGIERAVQQCLALVLGAAQPAHQRSRHRQVDQLQEQEAADEGRGEGQPEPSPAGRHRAEAQVGLEQQCVALPVVDGEVDLQQPAGAALEAVLRPRHIADLGLDTVAFQGLTVLLVQPVAHADEPRLVGVDDAPVGRPELDAYDVVTEHASSHQPVQALQRRRVTAHHGRRDRRSDDALAGQPRDLLGVADRLPAPGAADDRDGDQPDGDRRQQAGERELHDGRWSPGSQLSGHIGSDTRPERPSRGPAYQDQ